MTIAQVISSLPGSPSAVDQVSLRAALLNGFFHFIDPDTDPQTVDVTDSDTGAKAWVIGWQEKLWWLDPDDTTTAHDAITCIVTDDGGRYKVSTVDPWHGYSVQSATLTTPPDSDSPPPSYGDAWLVPSGASGDWAAKEDYIAIWTARSWQFIPPRVGRLLYVEDVEGYVHYTAAGSWDEGLGNNAYADASIAPVKLVQGLTAWIIQEKGTNTPPSIVKGVNYIVGGSPTGAFVGHVNEIATSDDGISWAFYNPDEGWVAYNVDDNLSYRFDGSTWNSEQGALIFFDSVFTPGTGSTTSTSTTAYSYSNSTAPTTSNRRQTDDITLSHAARNGADLRFRYSAHVTDSGGNITAIALYRDSEANAIAWVWNPIGEHLIDVEFNATAPDASSHTYKIAIVLNAISTIALDRRLFTIEEFA